MYRTNETHAPVPFRQGLEDAACFFPFLFDGSFVGTLYRPPLQRAERWTGVCDSVLSVFVFRKSAVVSLLGSVFALVDRFHVPQSYGRSFMSRL